MLCRFVNEYHSCRGPVERAQFKGAAPEQPGLGRRGHKDLSKDCGEGALPQGSLMCVSNCKLIWLRPPLLVPRSTSPTHGTVQLRPIRALRGMSCALRSVALVEGGLPARSPNSALPVTNVGLYSAGTHHRVSKSWNPAGTLERSTLLGASPDIGEPPPV